MCVFQGFEYAALGAVLLGWSFVIQDFFSETMAYKSIENKIPTNEHWQDKIMRWLISDLIEATAVLIYFILM